jgi:predicted ABC-type ATPase
MAAPRVVVLGGVNGAGKTTSAHELLSVMKIPIFTNADTIARGLNSLNPESVAFAAGRVMLEWLDQLARNREDFAFETTLATRSYAPRLKSLKQQGYRVYLFYTWVENPDVAVARVQQRVRSGGHNIPEEDIRRRYYRRIRNFLDLYQPIADCWEFFDNTHGERRLIACGDSSGQLFDTTEAWERVLRSTIDE